MTAFLTNRPKQHSPRFLAKTVKMGSFLHGSRVLSDGAPEEIRTPDPQIRSLVLYPAELRALDSAAGNRTTAPRHSYRLDPPLARVCTPYARAACAAQANASFSMRIR